MSSSQREKSHKTTVKINHLAALADGSDLMSSIVLSAERTATIDSNTLEVPQQCDIFETWPKFGEMKEGTFDNIQPV